MFSNLLDDDTVFVDPSKSQNPNFNSREFKKEIKYIDDQIAKSRSNSIPDSSGSGLSYCIDEFAYEKTGKLYKLRNYVVDTYYKVKTYFSK